MPGLLAPQGELRAQLWGERIFDLLVDRAWQRLKTPRTRKHLRTRPNILPSHAAVILNLHGMVDAQIAVFESELLDTNALLS